MRGTIAGLQSPHPLGQALPAVYQDEDPFVMRMTQGFDEVLAPVVSALDNLPAYLDPRLAPEDFLGWLAGWVGLELDETWEVDRRRAAISQAVDLFRRRGTAAGLADEIRLIVDGEVEVIENGGTAWSLDPGGELVGSARPALHVRVRPSAGTSVDRERVERVIAAAKPAHVPHRLEIVEGEGRSRKRSGSTEPPAGGTKGTTKPRTTSARPATEDAGDVDDEPGTDDGA